MMPDELPSLHVGDHVTDRDSDDNAPMLVVGRSPQPAAHYNLGDDQTVADVNPEYPAGDDVLEVVYPERASIDVGNLDVYAFPRSRLELDSPVHDRSEDDEDLMECAACGETGPAEEIQPTACPHNALADVEAE